MEKLLIGFVIFVLLASGCLQKEEEKEMSLKVTSVFGENEFIPSKYTCEGLDINPPLKIEGLSEKAVSIAIIVDDPDAPVGTFVHWVAWNIPPAKEIPEGIPKKETVELPIHVVQGKNDFGRIGYNGPCPPRGHGIHHYHFKVYVLDTELNLKPGATKKDLEKAMKGHIIQYGELIGLYERK
ncbi:YbhB/YbcL family Raf kinase inhibitor-like protein [Thermococcus paralvinellae]|uniref:Phospholipid-binding protein n=1 Tax=Thermococcus paralvinellae TaxID=582419 RepID=W0I6Z8_9EURY|nr:YbhB/YbcL family Raf kinase inhibitor-like protein [Thermococcus paralvinellae]AHF80230.1 Hypothetical protein TES1_0844 [Thermococcus paralvinellae]